MPAPARARIAERGGSPDFVRTLVADLASRATRDADGARWSDLAHRPTPGRLEPQTGRAMGNAGSARELLRHVRLSRGGDPRHAFTWPDRPAVRGAAAQATEPIRPVGSEVAS
ncbi:hypothetical protein ACIA6D_15665 [Streptomyces cacaoi]|uniref:hypothetical protein n=1 Tax=Streptomyces cacaoi TaxID=1898 RepID=UPI00374A4F5E